MLPRHLASGILALGLAFALLASASGGPIDGTPVWALPNRTAAHVQVAAGNMTILFNFYSDYVANLQHIALHYATVNGRVQLAPYSFWTNSSLGCNWHRDPYHTICDATFSCSCYPGTENTPYLPQYMAGQTPTLTGKTRFDNELCNVYQSTTDSSVVLVNAVTGSLVAWIAGYNTNDQTVYTFLSVGSDFANSMLNNHCASMTMHNTAKAHQHVEHVMLLKALGV
jgi:hypothetical protein